MKNMWRTGGPRPYFSSQSPPLRRSPHSLVYLTNQRDFFSPAIMQPTSRKSEFAPTIFTRHMEMISRLELRTLIHIPYT